eukprot:TRINITY_DN67826_c0_g1_i1.p2 TRINITY_DN67826_c0_g1~~TRINITY_DN67826_c0_g1_i1.p2  ORF type:complete len:138 (-),score=6.00 TRINITY_DN67826_c0_g1_i1:337-750(-)
MPLLSTLLHAEDIMSFRRHVPLMKCRTRLQGTPSYLRTFVVVPAPHDVKAFLSARTANGALSIVRPTRPPAAGRRTHRWVVGPPHRGKASARRLFSWRRRLRFRFTEGRRSGRLRVRQGVSRGHLWVGASPANVRPL